ncbi:MAG: AAA family ATPase [bacterium]
MRIQQLSLIAFGPFAELELDLRQGREGLHVLYGLNEAGKSTALRALDLTLFGIGHSVPRDAWKHGKDALRLKAVLRDAHGAELAFERIKKRQELRGAGGEVLDDEILKPFLRGLDRLSFERVFGIGHKQLVEGGLAILEQQGDVAKALFQAAGGGPDLQGVLGGLAQRADELFRARASTKAIHTLAAEYQQAHEQLLRATLASQDWHELTQRLDLLNGELETLTQELGELRRRQSQLRRLKRVGPLLRKRNAILAQVDGLGPVIALPEDFGLRCRATLEARLTERQGLEIAEAQVQTLQQKLADLGEPGPLLREAAAIELFQRKLGSTEKALDDRVKLVEQQLDHLRQAHAVLQRVAPALTLETAAPKLKPLLSRARELRALAGQRDKLVGERRTAEITLRQLREARDEGRRRLASLAADHVAEELRSAVASARRQGELEERLSGLQQTLTRDARRCALELGRLGLWEGTLEQLQALALPSEESIDRFAEAFRALEERRQQCDRQELELQRLRTECEQGLEILRRTKGVPSEEDLDRARSRREQGWSLLKRQWLDGEDVDALARDYDADDDLPTAYENTVAAADQVADVMRQHADKVHERTRLEVVQGSLGEQERALADARESLARRRAALDEDWSTLWAACDVSPQSPKEMRAWRQRGAALQQQGAALSSLTGEAQALQDVIRRHHVALRAMLERAGAPAAQDSSLGELMDRCERLADDAEAARRECDALDSSLKKTEDTRARTEADLAAWDADWTRAVAGAELLEGVPSTQVEDALEGMAELLLESESAETQGKRVQKIDRDVASFEGGLREFAERIGFPHDDRPADELVGQLNQHLKAQQKLEDQRTLHSAALAEQRGVVAGAKQKLAAVEEQLAELRGLAGVVRNEELEPAGERSRSHRHLTAELAGITAELAAQGDGLTIEALEREISATDPDSIVAEGEELESREQERSFRQLALGEERGKLKGELDRHSGSATAAEVAAQAEQIAGDIAGAAEQYLMLRAAWSILDQQLERYRKEHEGPLLGKASHHFAALTLGSFTSLRADVPAGGKPVLVGIRPDGQELDVVAMSDGTRDQLFLALRLAILEQHLQDVGPVPFVVDDVLINFDDARSKATLEVLAELAKRTQILLFTHHHHVVELAQGLEAEAGVFVHRLS